MLNKFFSWLLNEPDTSKQTHICRDCHEEKPIVKQGKYGPIAEFLGGCCSTCSKIRFNKVK